MRSPGANPPARTAPAQPRAPPEHVAPSATRALSDELLLSFNFPAVAYPSWWVEAAAVGYANGPPPSPEVPPPPLRPPPRGAENTTTATVTLFSPWDVGLPCWRIPAAARIHSSASAAGLERLIVFAEGRYSNGDGCEVPNASAPRAPAATAEDPCAGYFRNIFWRLSDDSGATWSPIRRLAGGRQSCLTDPAPLWHEASATLLVQYSAAGGAETWQHASTDGGESFSAGRLLNGELGPAAGKRPGPAGGLALASGRLMVA